MMTSNKKLRVELESSDDEEFEANTMTPEQEENMKLAINNPLIQYKIIEKLDFKELKVCRIVNKIWHSISSEVMLNSDCSRVNVKWDSSRKLFCKNFSSAQYKHDATKKYNEISKLNELNFLLKASASLSLFPCCDFAFLDGGDWSSMDPQRLFYVFGKNIKTLQFTSKPIAPGVKIKEGFRRILRQYVPNLEHLILEYFQHDWMDSELLHFPNLKLLELNSCYSHDMKLKILRQVPKSIKIKGLHLQNDFDLLLQVDMISTQTKFVYYGESFNEVILKRLTDVRPQLKKMTWMKMSNQEHISNLFPKMMDSSKNSLEELHLSEFKCNDGLTIPRLPKLKVLKLGPNKGKTYFNSSLNLQAIFPHLQILDFSQLDEWDDFSWNSHFPPDSSLPTVTTLNINQKCTKLRMTRLYTLCPNFNKVLLHCGENPNRVLRLIFKLWTHLATIEIQWTSRKHSFFHHSFDLDSVFTGRTKEACDELREMLDYSSVHVTLGNEETLANLKELKRLEIILPYEHTTWRSLPISRVSGVFALQNLPDCKLVVELRRGIQNGDLKLISIELGHYWNIQFNKAETFCSG